MWEVRKRPPQADLPSHTPPRCSLGHKDMSGVAMSMTPSQLTQQELLSPEEPQDMGLQAEQGTGEEVSPAGNMEGIRGRPSVTGVNKTDRVEPSKNPGDSQPPTCPRASLRLSP